MPTGPDGENTYLVESTKTICNPKLAPAASRLSGRWCVHITRTYVSELHHVQPGCPITRDTTHRITEKYFPRLVERSRSDNIKFRVHETDLWYARLLARSFER